MNTRYVSSYVSNLALMIAGGFLVVATEGFPATTVAWLTFAIAVGLTVVSVYLVASQKSIAQRGVGVIGSVLGAWTIVASLVFAPTTALWLGFASALAYVGIGLIGLTAHEVSTERVEHSLKAETERPTVSQVDGDHHAVAA